MKFMKMHDHPKSNVHYHYIPRKEGSRRLKGINEMANLAIMKLENYVKESTEHLLLVRG